MIDNDRSDVDYNNHENDKNDVFLKLGLSLVFNLNKRIQKKVTSIQFLLKVYFKRNHVKNNYNYEKINLIN